MSCGYCGIEKGGVCPWAKVLDAQIESQHDPEFEGQYFDYDGVNLMINNMENVLPYCACRTSLQKSIDNAYEELNKMKK